MSESSRSGTKKLMEGDDKPVDPVLRSRTMTTFLLQTIPWAIFVAMFILDEFVTLSFSDDLSEKIKQIFTYVYLSTLAGMIILLYFGGLISCKALSEGSAFVIMIIYIVVFSGFCMAYILSQALDKKGLFALSLGLPLLFLTLGHFLWAIFCQTSAMNTVFSSCLVFLSCIIAMGCLAIHDSINHGTNLAFMAALVVGFHVLVSCCWITAAKFSTKAE